MRKLLTLAILLLVLASSAHAQTFRVRPTIDGIYECDLGPTGFYGNLLVVMYSVTGSTGARFKIHLPPGSGIFSVSSPYAHSGDFTDLTLAYGTCISSGTWVVAIFAATVVEGYAEIWPADGEPSIWVTDCAFDQWPGGTWLSWCGPPNHGCGSPLATEASTWGRVKSLYR